MKFDCVRLAMIQAAEAFKDNEASGFNSGLFNSAGFSQALCRIAGVNSQIDGHLVRAILCGRDDVRECRGGCHWLIVENGSDVR